MCKPRDCGLNPAERRVAQNERAWTPLERDRGEGSLHIRPPSSATRRARPAEGELTRLHRTTPARLSALSWDFVRAPSNLRRLLGHDSFDDPLRSVAFP